MVCFGLALVRWEWGQGLTWGGLGDVSGALGAEWETLGGEPFGDLAFGYGTHGA